MSLSENQVKYGGIDARNIDGIDQNLRCEYCQLILLIPVQHLCCGSRLCRWCSKFSLRPGISHSICSFCQSKIERKQIVRDHGKQREVDVIPINCSQCEWTGSYAGYQQHLQEFHADLVCSDCHQHFYAVNLYEEHREETCLDRFIACSLPKCQKAIKRLNLLQHYYSETHQQTVSVIIKQDLFQRNKKREEMLNILQDISNNVSSSIEILSEDVTRIRSHFNVLKSTWENFLQQIGLEVKAFVSHNELIKSDLREQAEILSTLEKLEKNLTVDRKLYIDHDGPLILKFETLTSTWSPRFQIGPYGYAFILRVDTTSNLQNAEERWLSIYICLMQSDFDPILDFPFSYDIYFCLYDQSSQSKHVYAMIKAQDYVSEFVRPTTERNAEVGIAYFCPLCHLTDSEHQYRVDGKYFIGIYIDFSQERAQSVFSIGGPFYDPS